MTQPNPHPVMMDGEQIGWACPECKAIVQGIENESFARTHCVRICEDCNKEMRNSGWLACASCRGKRESLEEQNRFEKATKVDWKDYDGYVYCPLNDTFSASVEEFLEDFDDLAPSYIWACTPEEFKIDASNVLEQALSNHYEDARDNISDKEYEILQNFLDEWAAKQRIESWHPDYTRAVVFKNTCEKCLCNLMTAEVIDGVTLCEDCTEEADGQQNG